MDDIGFRPVPPGLALLAACGTWPRGRERDAAVRDAATPIDWPDFLRVVRRHRMAGIARDGLKAAGISPPQPEGDALAALARRDCREALVLVGEASRITRHLASANIAATIIKGPPLSILAYGDLAMRQCRDLDILVAAHDLAGAVTVLIDRGYRLAQPVDVSTPRRLDAWLSVKKDVGLRNPATGALIELHGRLTDNRYLIRDHGIATGLQTVVVGGVALPSLTGDSLLTYLCVHGAVHGWERLKWLADIQALLSGEESGRLDALYGRARDHGLHIPMGVAFLLCAHLFGMDVSPALKTRLKSSRRVRMLARIALKALYDPEEVSERRGGFSRIHASRLLLRAEPRYQAQEILRRLVDWPTVDRFGGGQLSMGLSMIVRPFRWAWCRRSWKPGTPR